MLWDGRAAFGRLYDDQLVDALAAEYDAERATIAAGVQALLQRMVAQDVVRPT